MEAVAEPEYVDVTVAACAENDVYVVMPGVDVEGVKGGTVSVAAAVVPEVAVATAVAAERYLYAEEAERQETPSSYTHLLH